MGILFDVIPSEGVSVNGNTMVFLGAHIDAADEGLIRYRNQQYDNSYYYFGSNLHITADEAGLVSEIEISANPDVEACLFGVNPFAYDDANVIELINNRLAETPEMDGDVAESTSVTWRQTGLSLWRDISPKDALESAEEAGAYGNYDKWMKEEYEPSRFFKTILIRKAESEG